MKSQTVTSSDKTIMKENTAIIEDRIIEAIYHIGNLKVMLDSDLAELYNVETRL